MGTGNVVVKLDQDEVPEVITHYKICAWKFEVPRPELGIPGYIQIWGVRSRKKNGIYAEALDVPTFEFLIQEQEFDEFIGRGTQKSPNFVTATLTAIWEFLIFKGYVNGSTVVEI